MTPSITRIQRAIASGASPNSFVEDVISSIAAGDRAIGAFAHIASDPFIRTSGPLAGISVGVKDIFDTSCLPTEYGSGLYIGWQPRADASIVSRLKSLGATIVGKTTTCPFATMDPTRTRNPKRLSHTPGGSSAGSAAAVAAGLVPLAIGTQTGGSTIRPASFCGVAAMKPSIGLVPTVGMKTLSWSSDTVGLFARTVSDVRLAFEAICEDSLLIEADRPLRFGIFQQEFAGAAEESACRALASAIEALKEHHAVHEITTPPLMGEAWRQQPIVQSYEGLRALAWEASQPEPDLPHLLRAEFERARLIDAKSYRHAQTVCRNAGGQADALFRDCDVLLTYAAPGEAPEGFASTGDARFNRLFSILGLPAVCVPGLLSPSGMPIGIQVVAPLGRDGLALKAAEALEFLIHGHVTC